MDLVRTELPMQAQQDLLRDGLKTAKGDLVPLHPVEQLQKERRERELESRMRDLTAQHGLAAAMKHQADHRLLSQFHRLPGLPSSFAALDNYTGADYSLRFEDWLGEPEMSPQYLANFHATMERKLGM